MKIINLKAEGFRSLKSIDWSPGDLNVLIGPNAGGKSNLLQLLKMLCISAQGGLGKFIKKDGMQSLVWNGVSETIKINLESTFNISKSVFTADLSYQKANNSCIIENEQLSIDGKYKISRSSVGGTINDSHSEIILTKDFVKNEFALHRCIKPLIEDVKTADFQKQLSSWKIFNYLDVSSQSKVRQPTKTSYETELDSDGENFVGFLHSLYEENSDFRDEINTAMKAAFPHFKELTFSPGGGDGTIQFGIQWEDMKKPHLAYVLSDGTLRFLYLITILAQPEPPALIAIDEPETGLHPKMLPIIAEYAAAASRKTQIIISTHSPEMLSAFGDRQKDVTVTVAEWQDGQTQLRVLSGENLAYWLKNYTLGELFQSGELEGM
jgi:predicted ATPase